MGVADRLSHVELEEVIRDGRNLMPPWEQYSENQFESLQMFLSNPELALVKEDVVQRDEMLQTEPMRYQSAWRFVLDSQGVPVIKPPWFRLTAYDLNEGTIKWQMPVGEVPHLVKEGLEINTGSASWLRGGPVITGGNLIFQPTGDKLRVYDTETGEEIWTGSLPAAADGIPAVYEVDGRQFVVVSAPGVRRFGRRGPAGPPQSTGYVAFALPQNTSM
jgi:quinoprotein glucose dehydrogenase